MKNNTKVIMESWRRFLSEEDLVGKPEDLDASGFDDEYAPDMPEDELGSEVYDVDEDGYDDSGRDFQEKYGQHSDPEDPTPEGEPVPADPDMVNPRQKMRDEEYYGLSMDDETEDDYYDHDFDAEPDF